MFLFEYFAMYNEYVIALILIQYFPYLLPSVRRRKRALINQHLASGIMVPLTSYQRLTEQHRIAG